MTIVFFTRRFYPLIGGVEKHVLEISKLLTKRGHSVIVVTENYQSSSLTARYEGIKILRVNAGKEGFFKKFRVWFGLLKYFKEIKNADIIHCHDIFFWFLPFKFIFPFKEVYTTFHGYEGNRIPNLRARFMHKLSEKLSAGNICIGNFYKKWYGTNETLISFGAVDRRLVEKGEKDVFPKKEAMFLGRLENETGFMQYLTSVNELKLSLDVYGEGSLINDAKKYAQVNKLNVNFKGFVPDVTNYISDYKIIFVSRYLGILEAFAVKRPVFAVYNNTIKKDYLLMTPFSKYISISGNSSQLTREIIEYKKGKSNIDVEKAFEWVKDKTWEEMVSTYLKLWSK